MSRTPLPNRSTMRTPTEFADRRATSEQNEDPDVTLICDFLIGALSEKEKARVIERLGNDLPFTALAAPIFLNWRHAPKLEGLDVSDAAALASWQRLQKKSEYVRLLREQADGEDDARDGGTAKRSPRRRRRIFVVVAWAGLALLLFVAGYYVRDAAPYFRPPPERRVVTTGAVLSSAFAIDGGAHITLQPRTRLVYPDLHDAPGTRELYLDGRAQIMRLASRPGIGYELSTPSAHLAFGQAVFDVDASDPRRTRVRLTTGQVLVSSRSHPTVTYPMYPGQSLVVTFGRPVEP